MFRKAILILIINFFAASVNAADHEIEKSLVNQSGNGSNHAFEWAVSYENMGANLATPGAIKIVDQVSPNQTVVSGSVQVPSDWSSAINSNAITFFNDDAVISGGEVVYNKNFLSINNHLGDIDADGDGYKPIPYYPNASTKKIYVINHHANADAKSFHCYDLNAVNQGDKKCMPINGSWPRKLPIGDGTGFTTTSSANEEFQIYEDKMYYAVTDSNKWGMGCFDLKTEQECGFFEFSSAIDPSAIIGIEGPFIVNDKAYFLDIDMSIHCYDFSLSNNCVLPSGVNSKSFKKSTGNNLLHPISPSVSFYGQIAGRVHEEKIYFTVDYNATQQGSDARKDTLCFDTNSYKVCSGWGNERKKFIGHTHQIISSSSNVSNYNNYLYYDYDANLEKAIAKAICTRNSTKQTCLNLSNGTVVNLPDVLAGNTSQYGLGGEVVTLDGRRTFFPHYYPDSAHRKVSCFDWATKQACAAPDPNDDIPEKARPYAGTADRYGCYWFMGHNNKLWSIDPTTAASPCNYMSFSDTYKSEPLCSGKKRSLVLKVNGITASDFDLLKLNIQEAGSSTGIDIDKAQLIADPAGFSYPLNSDEVTYTITATHADGKNGYTTTPTISIIDKSKTEFCYQTKLKCPVLGQITNTVNVLVNDVPISDVSATVNVDNPCSLVDDICLTLGVGSIRCRNNQLTGNMELLWSQAGSQGKTVNISASPAQITPNSYIFPSNNGIHTLPFTIDISGLPSGEQSFEITADYMIQGLSQPGLSSCCSAIAKVSIPQECGGGVTDEVVFPSDREIEALSYESEGECAVDKEFKGSTAELLAVSLSPYWEAKPFNVTPSGVSISPSIINSNTSLPVIFTSSGGNLGTGLHNFDLVFINSKGKSCKHRFTLGIKGDVPGGDFSTN